MLAPPPRVSAILIGLLVASGAISKPKPEVSKPPVSVAVVVSASSKTDSRIDLFLQKQGDLGPLRVLREELWLSAADKAPFLAWASSRRASAAAPHAGAMDDTWTWQTSVPRMFSPGYDAVVRVVCRGASGDEISYQIDLPNSLLLVVPSVATTPAPSKPEPQDTYATKVAAFDAQVEGMAGIFDAMSVDDRAALYGELKAQALGE